MSREQVAGIAAAELRVVARKDGFARVDGVDRAFRRADVDPRRYLDDADADARFFADELHVFAARLIELAEAQ